jgi:hypothetical protein
MAAFDCNGRPINTGTLVNIPCVVLSIGPPNIRGVQQVTLETKYKNNNGLTVQITIPSTVVSAGSQ